ncbi:MAG: MinD/ParA family protein [Blastocatellia bacterium]|nr:MinD/ParA family protein [Blastocatellia bacterium]
MNGSPLDIAARPRMRTLAVTSGKGGVGKSNLAVNVALELAALGRRISLFDADLALANADVLLGLNPQYHLGHVLAGQRSLDEVVIDVEEGLRLIPGGSGGEELANLTLLQHAQLMEELQALDADCMIIDTAAGIAGNVTGVLRAADEIIVVTTPDPTSIVDAYAMIKVLQQQAPAKPISIVVNNVVGVGDADRIFAHLQTTATRFLNCRLAHLGTVPRDAELAEAVREQVPVVWYAPNSPASRAMRLIARQLDRQLPWQTKRKAGHPAWSAIDTYEPLRSH